MAIDAKRVQAVFLAAVQATDPVLQAAILDRECSLDPELRQRVEALLRAHQEPTGILDQPAGTPFETPGLPSDGTVEFGRPTEQEEPALAIPKQHPLTAHLGPEEDEERIALEFLHASKKAGSLGRLGHYEVLEVLGQGAFGIVVRAFDETLQRVVAIKVLSPQLASTSPARKRFLREARAAAGVRHENVVQIHAVEEQPLPYLVMECIPGQTLQQKLDQTGPLEVPDLLRIAEQIARGLAAAHEQGLIHRDIKPANILLERSVEPKVKITDFGLARTADDASLSQSGVIAGTPLYMAPEQAKGEALDHRADLFSLGSVLYTMVSGRPPFRAATALAVLKRVAEDTPRPIREVIPEVPQWLCDLIARLHAKDPAQRFQSATEVVALLEQYRAYLQRPSAVLLLETVQLPRQRKLRRVAVLAAAAVVLFLGVVLSYPLWRPAGRVSVASGTSGPGNGGGQAQPFVPRSLTPEELAKLPSPLDGRKREGIPVSLSALVGNADLGQAPAELVAVLGDSRFRLPHVAATSWPAQDPDGKLLAMPCGNDVALFDASTGTLVRVLTGHAGRVYTVAFSPDGRRLATGSWENETSATVWEIATAKALTTFKGHAAHVLDVSFAPDGQRIVSSDRAGTVKVWSAATGKEILDLKGSREGVYKASYFPDGTRVLGNGVDGALRVWDATKGNLLETYKCARGEYRAHAFSPDGKLLATGNDAEILLWDADRLELVKRIRSPGSWLAFTPDSRTLLAGKHGHHEEDKAHLVTRWDLTTFEGKPLLPLASRGGWAVYHLSPDGKTLYNMRCGDDPEPFVHAYDAATGKELFPQHGHVGEVWTVAFSPGGHTLASGGKDGTVRLWDLAGWKPGTPLPPVRTLTGHTDTTWSVAFSPDGNILASGSYDGKVILWDVSEGRKIRALSIHRGLSSGLAFSPDGKTLAVGSNDGTIRLWDVVTDAEKPPLHWHQGLVIALAYSPDGRYLASAGYEDKSVCLLDATTGLRLHSFRVNDKMGGHLTFGPDNRTLAYGGSDAVLRIWDVETKGELAFRGHTGLIGGLALHPAGRLVATAAEDGSVRVRDRSSPERVLVIAPGPFGRMARHVSFDPTGRYLVTANFNGTVAILRLAKQGDVDPLDPKAWERDVAALPAAAQVRAVAARLQALNPGFDGKVEHKIDGDVVTCLKFLSDELTDISPVRALTGLKSLNCAGTWYGKARLSDLTPLSGMPLTTLNCGSTQVSDLTPLQGTPLTTLICYITKVSDLAPLKGMRLDYLSCHNTAVSDLTPLKSMPLTTLNCSVTQVSDLRPLRGAPLAHLEFDLTRVSDLTPLTGMRLTYLSFHSTVVSDLTPLSGMPLTTLNCGSTQVSDLTPLRGIKLTYFACNNTKVSDLAPLAGMPLTELSCDFQAERDVKILRALKTLEKINDRPAAGFWKEVDSK